MLPCPRYWKIATVRALAWGGLLVALPALDLMLETQLLFRHTLATSVSAVEHRTYLRDPEGGGRERFVLYGIMSYTVDGAGRQSAFQVTDDYWSSGGQYGDIRTAVLERKTFSIWYLRPLPSYTMFSKSQFLKLGLIVAICVPFLAALGPHPSGARKGTAAS